MALILLLLVSLARAHLELTGASPSVGGSCGTDPAVSGNDSVGVITVGSGINWGSCALTFASAWRAAPNCFVHNQTTANLIRPSSIITTVATFAGTMLAGDQILYMCVGRQ